MPFLTPYLHRKGDNINNISYLAALNENYKILERTGYNRNDITWSTPIINFPGLEEDNVNSVMFEGTYQPRAYLSNQNPYENINIYGEYINYSRDDDIPLAIVFELSGQANITNSRQTTVQSIVVTSGIDINPVGTAVKIFRPVSFLFSDFVGNIFWSSDNSIRVLPYGNISDGHISFNLSFFTITTPSSSVKPTFYCKLTHVKDIYLP